jgi:hypothetical protein
MESVTALTIDVFRSVSTVSIQRHAKNVPLENFPLKIQGWDNWLCKVRAFFLLLVRSILLHFDMWSPSQT